MWEHEAAYAYFAHGPLKRMELGQDSVQGTDYAYTINGWLKGINMPSLSPDHDPGGDGAATGPNTGFARDAFGMILGYHEKDFVKSGSVYDSSHSTTSSWHVPNPTFLYNGNISSWSSNSRRASGATDTALASVYHYDLLNRIRSDSTRLRGATAWSAVGSHWQSDYTYDGNGNITTLYRNNASGSQMDNLTYEYISGTNKLVNINDYQGASTGADIGDQDGNNYAYDATGNMTQDTAAGIEAGGIVWSPYNKIKSITKMGDDTTSKLVYLYDATGNRILKRYYKPYNTLKSTTWYVRDAQGNTLATYSKPSDSATARQKEVMLYGSTRLAVAETHAPYSDSETDTLGIFDRVSSRMLGEKRYELTDHLGNVRATVSDVVIDHSGDLDAEISTRTDYYPFGMIMGGRNSSLDDAHRYGFNGKENDNEVKGEGVQQDYGFRIYDARVARFLSVDPLTAGYPSWSPYPFAMNRVIDGLDLDGLEFIKADYAVLFAGDGGTEVTDNKDAAGYLERQEKLLNRLNESLKDFQQYLASNYGEIPLAIGVGRKSSSEGDALGVYRESTEISSFIDRSDPLFATKLRESLGVSEDFDLSTIRSLPSDVEKEFTKEIVTPSGDAVIMFEAILNTGARSSYERQNQELETSVHEGGHALYHALKLKIHLANGGSPDTYTSNVDQSERAATALEKIFVNTGGLTTQQLDDWRKKYVESDEE